MNRETFEEFYQGRAPWDIGCPQPAFVELEEAGAITGSVLDLGCGTGENALYLAERGHVVLGLDFVPQAIDRARAKAADRGLSNASFEVGDALQLDSLGRTFDTAIDCGLFHTFSDSDRPVYVASLSRVLRPGGALHILCFSDREPPGDGPRRVTSDDLRATFTDGWTIESIRPSRFLANTSPDGPHFSPGGPHAWLATIRRS